MAGLDLFRVPAVHCGVLGLAEAHLDAHLRPVVAAVLPVLALVLVVGPGGSGREGAARARARIEDRRGMESPVGLRDYNAPGDRNSSRPFSTSHHVEQNSHVAASARAPFSGGRPD